MPEQETLQGARDMATVLQRPHPLAAQTARPLQRSDEPSIADLDGLLAQQRAAGRGHSSDRVRALVHVRTEHDHHPRPLSPDLKADARRTRLAQGAATLLSSHAGTSPTGDERHNKRKPGHSSRQPRCESARRPVGTLPSASDITDRPQSKQQPSMMLFEPYAAATPASSRTSRRARYSRTGPSTPLSERAPAGDQR